MEQDRNVLILYTTAVCNLNCVYCYIDKNPALVEIDRILDESFQGDYYFNFAKKMFPNPEQLGEVEFWGGEPTLRLDRAYHTVDKLISYYPNLKRFMMSTNFTGTNWFDQFYGLMSILAKYPDRKFNFSLQLSIDGPTNINDKQRGEGVTELFTDHFLDLINNVDERLPKNVTLNMFFKPTLTAELFPMLQTKESIIKYYQFFENFYAAYHYRVKDKDRINMQYAVPNTATPSPHTKEDGILFANICRLCNEIEIDQRLKETRSLQFYREITPFKRPSMTNCPNVAYNACGGHCGSGHNVLGLLPYERISACHNGFTDLISDYKTKCQNSDHEHAIDFKLFLNDSHIMIHDLESFKKYEKIVYEFYNGKSTAQLSNIAGIIRALALAGQVDEKYKNAKEALKGAIFIRNHTSYCVRDNIGTTGSIICGSLGFCRLLLNGAREYIQNECER